VVEPIGSQTQPATTVFMCPAMPRETVAGTEAIVMMGGLFVLAVVKLAVGIWFLYTKH